MFASTYSSSCQFVAIALTDVANCHCNDRSSSTTEDVDVDVVDRLSSIFCGQRPFVHTTIAKFVPFSSAISIEHAKVYQVDSVDVSLKSFVEEIALVEAEAEACTLRIKHKLTWIMDGGAEKDDNVCPGCASRNRRVPPATSQTDCVPSSPLSSTDLSVTLVT